MPLSPESCVPGTSSNPLPGVNRYTAPVTCPAMMCWKPCLSRLSSNLVMTKPAMAQWPQWSCR